MIIFNQDLPVENSKFLYVPMRIVLGGSILLENIELV